MPGFVLLVGALVMGISLVLMARVETMTALIDRVFGSYWLYGAALLRLLLGAGLIAAAPTVPWSVTVEVIGWLFALGGLTLVVIPREVSHRLATRFAGSLGPLAARLWLSAALLFGAFLVAAALA